LPDLKDEAADALPDRHTGNPGNLQVIRDAFAASKAHTIDPAANTDAEAILSAIHNLGPEIETIDQGADLPFAQLDLNIGDNFIEHIATPLPHLNDFRKFQKLQMVRAAAALEIGQTGEAVVALKTMKQTGKLCGSQPLLISNLVEMACAENMLTAIWLGMKKGAWSDEDLGTIQEMLRGEDTAILDRLVRAMNMELSTMQIGASDFMKTAGGYPDPLIKSISDGRVSVGNWVFYFVPDGIWDHNKANGCRVVYKSAILPIFAKNPRASSIEFESKNPRNFLAHLTVPALQSVTQRGFAMSTWIDLARTACAVERFKLAAGGTYPTTLDEITPRFLQEIPVDLYSKDAETLKFELRGNRYTLYSVGGNGIDDNGEQVMRSSDDKRIDFKNGDLVWEY
jgi:hypothetical protein